MNLYDSHCHLNDENLLPDLEEVISRAREAGVNRMIVIGYDVPSSKKAVEIASAYEGVYAAVGYHPQNLDDASEEGLKEIEDLTKNPKVVAIGEIGLDYYWFKEKEHHEKQKEWFIKQIDLANRLGLPVSIHAREALSDTYEILKNHPPKHQGVLHCYSGSVEMMKDFQKLGLYFGFDGPITYKNAVTPKECVKACLEDKILVETDSPYLSPTPFRGQRNEPKNIVNIANAMAELRGVTIEEMSQILTRNFECLFHMKHE